MTKGPDRASAPSGVRVQRALAHAGIASRRRADDLVAAGRVRVNGRVAVVGETVDPDRDEITVDGTPVVRTRGETWLVMHKPAGVLTTARDERGATRRTVFDLVPPEMRRPGLRYVGRLDYMTEGLLLLTTDGVAAHRLTHPSHAVARTYVATVQGNAILAAREFRRGIQLEDGIVRPHDVTVQAVGDRRWEIELTITEGRTHEVRRACEAANLRVERLIRTRFGPIELGKLPAGAVRALTAAERRLVAAQQ
jgi:23S rRNA pseudouridine2605 synthase